jgi:hypothetical protein
MKYYSVTRNEVWTNAIAWMNLKDIKSKKPDTRDYILYDSICRSFPEKANQQRQKID